MWKLLVLLSCCSFWSMSQRIHSIGGPFRLIPRSAEQCPVKMRGSQMIRYEIHIQRKRRPENAFEVSGFVESRVGYDNNASLAINLASWNSVAGWKDNAIIITYPRLCEAVLLFSKAQYIEVIKSVFGEIILCPMSMGILRFNNATVDISVGKLKHFIYGRWRITSVIRDSKRNNIGCSRVYADTVPIINSQSNL